MKNCKGTFTSSNSPYKYQFPPASWSSVKELASRVDRFSQIPQVKVCFLCLPPGFPAVPHYFNRGDPLLNHLDVSGFAWNTKNLFGDELNVLKRKLNVKSRKAIEDYRYKSCTLCQNNWSKSSGRNFQKRDS